MVDLSTLKVTELKAMLKERNLAVGGLKKDLVERLQAALDAEEVEGEEEEEAVEEEAEEEEEEAASEPQEVEEEASSPAPEEQSAQQSEKAEEEEDEEQEEEDEQEEEEGRNAEPSEAGDADASEPTAGTEAVSEEPSRAASPAAESPVEETEPKLKEVEKDEPTGQKADAGVEKQVEGLNIAEKNEPEPMETDPKEVEQAGETPLEQSKSEDVKMEDADVEAPAETTGSSDKEVETKDLAPKVQSPTEETSNDAKVTTTAASTSSALAAAVTAPNDLSSAPVHQEATAVVEDTMDTSPDLTAAELRKRKRRSPSPPPTATLPADQAAEEPSPKKSRQEGAEEPPLSPTVSRRRRDSNAKPADIRFKSLTGTSGADAGPSASQPLAVDEEDEDDSYSTPALHPATTALYIRDLMRPLKPPALRSHLLSLATKPGDNTPSEDIIRIFYTNPLKTHAFVVFESTYYATRVRAGLNGRKFPLNEKGRKPLWVDFIPEEVVEGWIAEEEDGAGPGTRGGGRGMVRWNVVYESDADGNMRVWHEEDGAAGSVGRIAAAAAASASRNAAAAGGASGADDDMRGGGGGVDSARQMVLSSNAPPAASEQSQHQQQLQARMDSTRAGRLPPDMPRADRDRLAQQQAARDHNSNNHRDGRDYSSSSNYARGGAGASSTSTSKNFQTIDQLFLSTQTKPKLYYLPVPEDVARKRLEEMKEKEKLVGVVDGLRDPRERPGAPNWGGAGKPRRGGRDGPRRGGGGLLSGGGRGGDFYVPGERGADRERDRDREGGSGGGRRKRSRSRRRSLSPVSRR